MSGGGVTRSSWQRLIAAIEPWYNWGEIHVERMQGMRLGSDGYHQAVGEGSVRYFELQWFGIHFAVHFGRAPPASVRDDVAARDPDQTYPIP